MSDDRTENDASGTTAATSACAASVTALAAGKVAEWQGLPSTCTRAEIESVLSFDSPPAARDQVWTGEVHYHPTEAAPDGVLVHYADDRPSYLLVVGPALAAPLEELLGKPEGMLPSQLAGADEQWVYASRGLDAYVATATAKVIRLYAFAPTTVEEFGEWGIAHVKVIRDPVRRR